MLDITHKEVAVLGAMLLDPLAIADATAKLTHHDFAIDAHQRVYRAIGQLVAAGEGVDLLTVRDQLDRNKELEAVGGVAYLAFLTDGIPRHMNIASYVSGVVERSTARRSIPMLQTAINRLQEGDGAAEVLDDLSRLLTQQRPDETRWARDYASVLMAQMEKQAYTVIPTGIPDLDAVLRGGYRTKELTVIGAFPSGGKSALVRQGERAAMERSVGTHAASIEIAGDRWLMHHAARVAGLPAWKTREPERLSQVDRDYMMQAFLAMDSWHYRIDDAAGLTIQTLLARWRLSAMRHGTKFFTLDFMQLLVQDAHKELSEMANIVRLLKQFAKDYDVAVVALSQLTEDRGSGKSDGRPRLNQMRGSGVIRQIADVVILPYRPEDEAGSKTGEDELILGKNREGVTGSIKVRFVPEVLEFQGRNEGY